MTLFRHVLVAATAVLVLTACGPDETAKPAGRNVVAPPIAEPQ